MSTALMLAGAVLAVAAHLAGARRLPARLWGWRRYAFAAGVATTVLCLIPPVDARADQSFVSHMEQHLVLMWVAAPLLALGAPGLPWLVALPRALRRRVSAVRAARPVRRARAAVLAPVVLACLDGVVVIGWHLPALYEAALHSPVLHEAEHASFLFAAWLMWSPLAGPHPRLRGGMAVLYVFVTGFPSMGVGAGLVTASHPLYPAQTGTGPAALATQQTAGVLMWIPPTFLSLLLCAALLLAWFWSMERASPGGAPLPAAIPPPLPSDRPLAPSVEVPR